MGVDRRGRIARIAGDWYRELDRAWDCGEDIDRTIVVLLELFGAFLGFLFL